MNTVSLFCDFTVAIPTYNGAKRLGEVLEHLKWQLGTENITWEVIVVDNNSTDDTKAVVQKNSARLAPLKVRF